VLSELSRHGIASRFGQRRTDVRHQAIDPVIVAAPWVAAGGLAYTGVKAVAKRRRRS
jgi:hypothetical protein